jgi:prepilin-type N-terminal cleavage/methylation domain-containing protein
MKGVKQPQGYRGYTIVEVMIVMAVSGVMFVIAANFVSGKQARTAFTLGSNAIDSVNDGKYADVPLSCSVLSTTPRKLKIIAGSASGQGTSHECVFLGQLLHFNVTGTNSDSTKNFDTVFLAGAKTSTTGGPLSLLSDSALTSIMQPNSDADSDLTHHDTIPQGLQVDGMNITYSGGTDYASYNIGFVQGLGALNSKDANSYSNGAQTLTLIADTAITTSATSPSAISAASPTFKTVSTVVICLTDGTRHSHITIGGNGGVLKAIPDLSDTAKVCT